MCAETKLKSEIKSGEPWPLPDYLRAGCEDMVGGPADFGPLRLPIQRLFLGQSWIDLPEIKRKVCEVPHPEAPVGAQKSISSAPAHVNMYSLPFIYTSSHSDLPTCEQGSAPPCGPGLAAAPVGLPELPAAAAQAEGGGRRCLDCQEVVADMHFVARRLQLDPHRRKRHLEHMLGAGLTIGLAPTLLG